MSGRGNAGRLRLLLAVLLGATAVSVGIAHATVGDIFFSRCVSTDGSGGNCSDAPDAFAGPTGVAISPGGGSLYAVGHGSLSRLATHPLSLTYRTCARLGFGSGSCPGTTDYGQVTVAPDGDDLYVSDAGGDAVRHFSINDNGLPKYENCVSDDGSGGNCTAVPGSPLDGSDQIAISKNGKSVYVTGANSGAVTQFTTRTSGRLDFSDCVDLSGLAQSCTPTVGPGASSAGAVAVSPDGKTVYVADTFDSRIFELHRDRELEYLGCTSATGNGDLCSVAGPAFDTVYGLAVSPDGKSVYSAGGETGVVTHFHAKGNGKLSVRECVSSEGSGGACADATGYPFENTSAIAMSPDGRSVYVTSEVAEDVASLSLDGDGVLHYRSCISSNGSHGCLQIGSSILHFAGSVAVSSQSDAVFVGGPNGVVRFERQPLPPRLKFTSRPGDRVTTSGHSAQVRFGFQANRKVTLTCRLDSASFAACDSPKQLRASVGRHVFHVKGTDLFGKSVQIDASFRVVRRN